MKGTDINLTISREIRDNGHKTYYPLPRDAAPPPCGRIRCASDRAAGAGSRARGVPGPRVDRKPLHLHRDPARIHSLSAGPDKIRSPEGDSTRHRHIDLPDLRVYLRS